MIVKFVQIFFLIKIAFVAQVLNNVRFLKCDWGVMSDPAIQP